MPWDSTPDDWERLGRRDPYWAVISDDAFLGADLPEPALAAFLQTGEEYVADLWAKCEVLFAPFAPARALDFGCGVGRVALPLARRTASVLGVDIADSMLAHARRLAAREDIGNVEFVRSEGSLSALAGGFDLVHSTIVFQHVPAATGLPLLQQLLQCAKPGGGTAVVHVLYDNPRRRALPVRIAARALRPLRLRRGRAPAIQMNAYSMNTVFRLLHEAGMRRFHVELTDHAGHLGATVFGRREGPSA